MSRTISCGTSQYLRHDSRRCVGRDVCLSHSRDELVLDFRCKVGTFPILSLFGDPERELLPADRDRSDEGAGNDLKNHIEERLLIVWSLSDVR